MKYTPPAYCSVILLNATLCPPRLPYFRHPVLYNAVPTVPTVPFEPVPFELMLMPVPVFIPVSSRAFLLSLSCLQNRSNEHPIHCCCKWSVHMACSSLLRCAFAIRLISLTTSSRSEYHCSSLSRLNLHLLPHLLSSEPMKG